MTMGNETRHATPGNDGVFTFVISSSDIREKSNDEITKEIEEAWNGDDGGTS